MNNSVVTPKGSQRQESTLSVSVETSSRPAETSGQPAEALNQPAEALNPPAEALNPPAEALNPPAEAPNLPFEAESVQLQNRLSRLVDVKLRCFAHNGRYCIILVASPQFPARQLNNSAEHLAYQLIQRLEVSPEDVDFIQYQPGEEPEWLRWRFQWVGTSPIQAKSLPLNQASLESFVMPMLAEGEMFSLLVGPVPAVA